MSAIVIACVGSPFGADNLGLAVAETLRSHPVVQSCPEHLLRIEASDRPQLNLLSQIEGAELAIIVDAVRGEYEVGQIACISEGQLDGDGGQLSSHDIGVAQALALGRALNSLPSRLLILGISVGELPEWLPESEDLMRLADSIVGEVVRFMAQREQTMSTSWCTPE